MEYAETSIAGIFHNRAEKYRHEACLRCKEQGTYSDISWDEMQKRVVDLGCGLITLGVRPGDIVSIFSENCWQWLVADLAILSIAAADAPIYATNSGGEAAYIIRDSGSKIVLVSDRDHLERVLSVRNKMDGLTKIITFDPIATDDADILSLDEVMKQGAAAGNREEFENRLRSIRGDKLATLIYTSGTTGDPKGVMLTHDNFVANIKQSFGTHPMIGHHDTALSFLPWSHSLGRTISVYLMIHIGAVNYLAESFQTILEDMTAARPTLVVSVPRLFEKIHSGILSKLENAPPSKKKLFGWATSVADRAVDYRVQHSAMPLGLKIQYGIAEKVIFSKLRSALGMDRINIFISGGGALAPEIDRFFNGIGINVHNGYGLTETSPVTNVNTFDVFQFGSVGPVLPDTKVRIADDGEILIKGPQVMKGYFNKPDATASAFTDDGWFMSGDIGFIDDTGCLHITDRKKDLIVTAGGKNISPQNIENTLTQDLFIEQAVTIGEGKKYLSALIVPSFAELSSYAKNKGISFADNEELIKNPEIVAFYDGRIKELMKDYARVEQLRKFTLLPNEFTIETGELTPTLKLKRKVINSKFSRVIDGMYEG
ncbi:MAG: long-chain fatty acid--CoA ligase [Deltaproteobacteria bacterium]|nr:long-chain fatty acid--CoA ligase [Deltaproteobacteria bacterium]